MNILWLGVFLIGLVSCVGNNEIINDANISETLDSHIELFTYKYDPEEPNIMMEVDGVLILSEECLFIQSLTKTEFLTPIFPDDVTRWDGRTNTIYVRDEPIRVGDKFVILGNGVQKGYMPYLREKFVSEGPEKCLLDSWVKFD